MKNNFELVIKATIIVFFISQSLFGQKAEKPVQNNLNDYGIIQFISTTEGAPENIIKLDNNSQILYECINGCTREKLKNEGIHFNESQLRLLTNWRLLKKEKDTYQTDFPVLNFSQTKALREKTKIIAKNLGQILEEDVQKLEEELKQRNRAENIYSILFSYIIDGIWNKFEKRGLIDNREVTAEHPFWDGEIWALFPKRDFHCGTNKISDKGIKFLVNWSPRTIKNMIPFVSDWKNLIKMFDNYIDSGKVFNPKAKEVFESYNLFNDKGIFTIPIIVENDDDELFKVCDIISNKIAENVNKLMDLNSLTKQFNFSGNKQTLVIVYHEMMWDLLKYFEDKNLITKPVAFSDPENTKPQDISNLIFIVRSE